MYLLAKLLMQRVLASAAALALTLASVAQVHAVNIITTVAPADLGSHNAIALGADGYPVVGHLQLGVNTYGAALFVTKCGNTSCTANNTTSLVDDAAVVSRAGAPTGNSLSIVVPADGLPVISYLTINDFKVVKCGNAACSAGNTLTTLSTDLVGLNEYPITTSIKLSPVTGLPIVSFSAFVQTAHVNYVAACKTPDCLLATQSQIGGDTYYLFAGAMAIGLDGFPVFSYYQYTGGSPDRFALMVLKCGSATCKVGNTTTEVDTPNPLLFRPRLVAAMPSSIAIGADGFPIISYVTYPLGVVPDGYPSSFDSVDPNDPTPTVLTVAKCINVGCTSGTQISTVDGSSVKLGEASSISVPADGRPVVSYYDRTHGALKVAKCGNAACSSHNVVNVVDTKVRRHFGEYTYSNVWSVTPGVWSSMTVPRDGRPIITYSDQDGLLPGVVLKVLRCGSASCAP